MDIKQFNLTIVEDQITTSGNMTLNDVASALITLAYGQGRQEGLKEVKDGGDISA